MTHDWLSCDFRLYQYQWPFSSAWAAAYELPLVKDYTQWQHHPVRQPLQVCYSTNS